MAQWVSLKDSQAWVEHTGLVVEHIGHCLRGLSFFFLICGGSILPLPDGIVGEPKG